jgi:hypothetical protein
MKNKTYPLFSLITFLFIFSCQSDKVAGGSTDVETGGISGVAQFNGDASPVSNTKITLTRSSGLLFDSLASVTTDESGQFNFENLTPGNYAIESYHSATGKRNLNTNVAVQANQAANITSIMHTPGEITITNIPSEFKNDNYSLIIPELRLQKSLNVNTDSIVLEPIPAGVSLSIHYALDSVKQGLVVNLTLSESEQKVLAWP